MRTVARLCLVLYTMMTFTACGSAKKAEENPLLAEWTAPFGVPPFDKIRTEHYLPAFERAMSLHDAEIDAIVSNNDEPTFENTMLAYDASGKLLARLSLVFGMVSAAETNDGLQAVQEQLMPKLAAHEDRIRMNDRLFGRIRTLYDTRRTLGLDAEQMRLLEKTYDEFVRSGALLDAERKARLGRINEELSLLQVRFGRNVLAETNAFVLPVGGGQLGGLSNDVRDAARKKALELGLKDKYAITLDGPSRIPFLTYSPERELREQLYKAYVSRGDHDDAHDNKQIVNDLIRLRLEKAGLLGYDSYADYVLSEQMARTPEAAGELLEGVWEPALARAREELAQMDSLLQTDRKGAVFEAWDWWYYAEKLRKRKYAFDEEMLRPYFSIENVQTGIFFLANRLYGITFRPVVVPVYHPDAMAYEALDADGTHLGVLYFDFFPREGKSGGAWCGNFTEQYYEEGERVAPVVGIVCNFTPPVNSSPALLNLDETATLFHEFGHALHFLFHDVKYRGLTDVEGDFVELPSQIMENWAFEPEMLRHYATHYRTGEIIPDHLVQKLRRSAGFNQGFALTELVAAARTDLDLHRMSRYEPFEVDAYEKQLTDGYGLIPQIAPRYRFPYFSHIFDGGYSAGYYFYIWAEVLDKDAFEAFRESGDLFDRRIAHAFRTEILEKGGSADGMTLYRSFRGKNPDKRAMLRARGLSDESGATAGAAREATGSAAGSSAGTAAAGGRLPSDGPETVPMKGVLSSDGSETASAGRESPSDRAGARE